MQCTSFLKHTARAVISTSHAAVSPVTEKNYESEERVGFDDKKNILNFEAATNFD
jgi:hypothetical protein